ncbi:MAG: RNA helicase [Leptospiraceae bacterium]|nr:MAG: RNA helicase [Leptospiraceae bacterium]
MKNIGASTNKDSEDSLFSKNFSFLENKTIIEPANYNDFFNSFYQESDLFLALKILEAYKIRIHYIYDKLSSLSNSRTRLLPHQIEATHRVINALKPRFLLADEVGLGKTIEAGLIMKELMLRKNYKNIIIVVPAPLQIQWQQELKNKFNEDFDIINYKNFHLIKNKKTNKIITSIDFIKNPKYYEPLLEIPWEFAIFDEAHRLRRDYNKITQAYHFADKISQQVEALLLLSATPFRGKIEELYFLIKLLDPHLLGPEHSFFLEYVIPSRNGESIKKIRNIIDKIIIRRRKIDVGGFTKRIAKTIKFDLSPEERIFYDETTEYVKKEYNLSKQIQNRAIGFIMIVFQKLLDSSTRALIKALEKRKFMLETKLFKTYQEINKLDMDIDEIIEYSENEDEILENISHLEDHTYTIQDIRKEILTLSRLISLGKRIKQDTKAIKLKETIESLKKNGHNKIIIFTQFRTTQDYLVEILNEYKVNVFHGSLTAEQKENEILEFKEKGEILICTEAGGEGRNLQFSDVLINYDLPWSPLKMEQRIGRIHRFGQKNDVLILNFSTKDTVAERVLYILENKIRIFEESIGPSDMLLGSIEEEVNLSQFIMDFVSGKISKDKFEENISHKIETAKKSYKLLSDLVSPSVIDFNLIDYYKFTQKERTIDNLHIEKITLNYLKDNKNSIYKLKKIKTIKNSLKQNANIYQLLPENKLAVFDSSLAVENDNYIFLAVGHPLVDEALSYYLNHPNKKCIIKFQTDEISQKGIYFVFIVHYNSNQLQEKKEIINVFIPSIFSTEFQIVKKMEIEEYFLKQKKLPKNIETIPLNNTELETIQKLSEKIYLWLVEEAKNENSHWFKGLQELYIKEQYKLEISYGKKIRNLEEKKDIEKLRYKMNPTSNRKAILTRTENAINQAKKELEEHIRELHHLALIKTEIELFQIYWVL